MKPAASVPRLAVGEQPGRGEANPRHPLHLHGVELVGSVAGLEVGEEEVPEEADPGAALVGGPWS
jgi:hypothetical protein